MISDLMICPIECFYIADNLLRLKCLCIIGGADVLYHRFNAGSSGAPVNPPRLPNSDYSCVVATTGDWRLARCTDQHHVVCQSGRPVYSHFVSDRFSFLLLRVLCG